MSMYLCDAPCPSNEELARRIQEGDPEAASLLLSQNEGYLTMLRLERHRKSEAVAFGLCLLFARAKRNSPPLAASEDKD